MTTTALPGREFDVLYDDRECILSRLERPLDSQPTPPERAAATDLALSVTGRFRWKCATGEIVWSRETYGIFAVGQATRPTIQVVLSRSHPEDRAALQQLFNRVMRELQDWDLEHRLLLPDGTVKSAP
jgi:hypothetical protein